MVDDWASLLFVVHSCVQVMLKKGMVPSTLGCVRVSLVFTVIMAATELSFLGPASTLELASADSSPSLPLAGGLVMHVL